MELSVKHTPEFTELVVSSPDMRHIVACYVRQNTVTLVKERNGEVLRAATFGRECLACLVEYLKDEPETENELLKRMYKMGGE